MKIPLITNTLFAVVSMAWITSCSEKNSETSPNTQKPLPDEVRRNNVDGLPGAIHEHAAQSPIQWQPWTRETVASAKAANRMMFAFVAKAQASGYAESLDALGGEPATAQLINDHYVPVIIDGDAVREIGLFAADLSMEINQNVNLPFFIWLSPAGHPIAWISSPWIDAKTAQEHFRQSHSMVERIWQESPEYVLRNSEIDHKSRYERISKRVLARIESDQPKLDTVRAIRSLTSLYDPLSRNYEKIGGLFPIGTLDLLASAAMQPGLPEDVIRNAGATTRELVKDLLASAMFDPLDGGLFSARRGASWSLPRHNRHSIMQSRAAVALFRIHQATGKPIALERALGVIDFAERHYQTRDGLYAIGKDPAATPEDWLWTSEDVEAVLGEDDAQWWAELTGMQTLGNIPYEIDPQREFFRLNSLALKASSEELAQQSGMSVAEFNARFEAARGKLVAARTERLGEIPRDEHAHAVASFRMVSAYAAAYTATGDQEWQNKSVELLKRSRGAFSSGAKLRVFASEAAPELNEARAFVYAVAIQSILDVVQITGDTGWLDWSDDLATVMTENFTSEGFIREAAEDVSVLEVPMTDLMMLFEDSTVGLLNFAECRLAALNRPLLEDLRKLAGTLPVSCVDFPVQHTDIIQSFLVRGYGVTLVYNDRTAPELIERIQRLPIRMFHRRAAAAGESLPERGCLLLSPDRPPEPITTAEQLGNALLPIPTMSQ